MKKVVLFLVSFLFYFSLCAQQTNSELAHWKTAMIFKIIQSIKWQNEAKIDTFKIGIVGTDSSMFNSFKKVAKFKTIKGKPIRIIAFYRFSKIQNIQLLYVSSAVNSSVDRLSHKIQGKNILLISDESNSNNTMVNLYINRDYMHGLLNFDIFRHNLEKEGFSASQEMLIYGGSKKDIQNIIAETKQELEEIQRKLSIKQELLKVKEKETIAQIVELEKQKKIIALHQIEMKEQNTIIDNQLKKVRKQEEYIKNQQINLTLLSDDVENQHRLLNDKITNLKEKERIIKQREVQINKQITILENQQSQIKKKQELIEDQEKKLLNNANQIVLQKRFIYVVSAFLFFIIVLVIIAFKAYRSSKRQTDILFKKNKEIRNQNQEINYQKRILLEKTEELNLTNFTLLERQEEIELQTQKLLQQSDKLQLAVNQSELEKSRAENAFKELEEMQTQLINAEKLASLGQVAAGVAHEVNTPLGAIKASIGTMLEQQENIFYNLLLIAKLLSDDEAKLFFLLIRTSLDIHEFHTSKEERKHKRIMITYLKEQLDLEEADVLADNLIDMGFLDIQKIIPFTSLFKHEKANLLVQTAYEFTSLNRDGQNILIAVNKAAKVVYALKSYTRASSAHEMQTVELDKNINTILILYYNQIKQGIDLVLNFEKDIFITCFPDELNQVWTNIIHNAIQAMDNKGTLTISTEKQNDVVFVKINDTGSGIPIEIQEKIFEPFFTTKVIGEGSGLGLDIVTQILKHHQGSIYVESVPQNTTFTIELPLKGIKRVI